MHMMGFVGVIFTVMVIGAVALVAFLITRTQSPSAVTHPPMRETPLQILDRRFAAGEVTAEDYRKARDLLSGGG